MIFLTWNLMANSYQSRNFFKLETSTRKKSEFEMGIEPTTLRDLVGCSNHWGSGDSKVSKAEMWVFDWNLITRLHSKISVVYFLFDHFFCWYCCFGLSLFSSSGELLNSTLWKSSALRRIQWKTKSPSWSSTCKGCWIFLTC